MKAMKKSDPAKAGAQTDTDKLKKRKVLVGDPEDIVYMDWIGEWTELRNLGPETRRGASILDRDICKKKP